VNAAPAAPVPERALALLIEEFVESRTRENTRVAYRKAIADFLGALGISTADALLGVQAADVVRYRNGLQRLGRSPSTVNQRLAAVRGLYGRLLRLGRIGHNPADSQLVEGFRVSSASRTEGLTLEEVASILATCDGTLQGLRDRALLMTLYYQGLRRSEASTLRYRDVTTRRGLMEVRDAKNNPYETIRLRPEVGRAIEDYLEVLNRDLRKRETRPDDPVFCSLSRLRSFGRRLAPSSINEIVKERARRAGITRRITAHSWRHSCTTHGLQRGVPLHQVQRHLRHKDVKTTLRYDRDRDVRKNPMTDALPALPNR
jgi:integrase/recombinase XerD